jgi:hypothetical protein
MGAVEEDCSVSCCLSKAPPDAIALWSHNTMSLYASEALALSVIPASDERSAYDLYAYCIAPLAFHGDGEPHDLDESEGEAVRGAETGVERVGPDYQPLGWDIVGNSLGWTGGPSFECSPLTCNSWARKIATNRFGLIDDFDRAVAVARRIASDQPEPGTYYLVHVWRKARAATS